jgi:hypothetical protein
MFVRFVIVFQPLTATEWDSQQAKEDLESLRSFLTKTTNNVLENPKWLEPTIKNEIAGIRIFKDPLLPCQVNFQFTVKKRRRVLLFLLTCFVLSAPCA